MAFASKVLLLLALLIMPIGTIMIAQGGYFYSITTRESVSGLVDAIMSDLFQNQASQLIPYCREYNMSCSSLSETRTEVCQKTSDMRREADNIAKSSCSNAMLICNDSESARDIFCQILGSDNSQCIQLRLSVSQLQQAEDVCTQLNEAQQKIDDAKTNMYTQEIETPAGRISLAKINSIFSNALLLGILITAISIAMVYAASRNIFTVIKCTGSSLLFTGICCAIIGIFGYQLVNGIVPSGNMALPISVETFIKNIFDFQVNSGILLSVAGASLMAIGFFARGYFEKQPEVSSQKRNA